MTKTETAHSTSHSRCSEKTGSSRGGTPADDNAPPTTPASPVLIPLTALQLANALDDDETRLHAWLVWRDIERRGWSTVAERDLVAVLALRVMLSQGTVVARETSEGLWLVERPIVADESEDEREARLAAEAWDCGAYDDGSVRVWEADR